MKNLSCSLASLAFALSFGASGLFAHSDDPAVHAVRGSGEVSLAVAGSAASVGQVASGVVAVPLWVSGGVARGAGTVLKVSGTASADAGQAATQGARELWDFATGETSARPPLNRTLGVPAARTTPAKDLSPAEAMRSKL